MKIADMNWMQVEDYLRHDDRAVVPLGSTEQHAYLSLSVDSILSERVALEAAEPLNVPVFPVIAYGITPYFRAYPGTVSLKMATYAALVRDVLDCLHDAGFRRILLCNGHGGNLPAQTVGMEWMACCPGAHVRFHNWWNAPKTFAKVQEVDPVASHASWMENFPWTRLPNLKLPDQQKPLIDIEHMRTRDPVGVREYLGDGNFGGRYQKSDEEMLAIWTVAVDETRTLIEEGWG
ncbi:MAG: creatininase family protein [Methylobacteriaceae bacterium]|nr:creatininase family protein [Methylobacteriaceae bacterium]